MLLFNARSIINKFDELCISLSIFKPGLICVTESWMNDDIEDSLFHIEDYNLLRNDRVGRRGGGVCAWVHERFSPHIVSPFLSLLALNV